ncbi:hypothetical protein [Flavobacterium sp. UBA6031]|uniref:hypothetical protein n=1 Tax=Flavobacterium sp. UBA6031 TaxID=1946551 RepID=UPI0025BBB95E|nr:hypothetical protein [Flavobacterium sp. UBA6031]
MKKTKIYLKKYRQKSSKPADEAWMKMAEMLDAEMPASNQKSKKRAFAISFSQFAISIVAAIVFVGGGTFITLKTIESKKEIHTIKHAVRHLEHDSLTNKTVQIEDSVLSTKTDIQTINSANQKANEENKLQQQQNNNQTLLSTTTTQLHTPQKVVSVKKFNLSSVIVDNHGLKANKSNDITNSIEKQPETTFIDSINTQNHQLNSILPKDENLAKVKLQTKTSLKDSFEAERNSPIITLLTKEKKMKGKGVRNFQKNNHLFLGLSGYNGLLFSKNVGKNIYSYGEILTIGIRNTKYNLTVETGIGFQSLEYHVPYSRTLYTYQATGEYDSTITVSSYKYSRYNIIIPFLITKEIFHYNTIFLDVKTGINTSIFLSRQRLFNQLPVDIQLIEDSYPISDINFSFALSPQFRWDVNDKFSLNINAGGIFYLNSFYQNYSLKPIGINLSAEIHYLF